MNYQLIDFILDDSISLHDMLIKLHQLELDNQKSSHQYKCICSSISSTSYKINNNLYKLIRQGLKLSDLKKYLSMKLKKDINVFEPSFTLPNFYKNIDLISTHIFYSYEALAAFDIEENDPSLKEYFDNTNSLLCEIKSDFHVLFLKILEEMPYDFSKLKYIAAYIIPGLELEFVNNNFDVDALVKKIDLNYESYKNYEIKDAKETELEDALLATLASILINYEGFKSSSIMSIFEAYFRALIVFFNGDLTFSENDLKNILEKFGNEENNNYISNIGKHFEDDIKLCERTKII